ncbi:MAG: arginine--tRNA ligase [archaeon]|nr:MAG: arginine--tRNA ligase [archaeon]
MKFLEFEDEVRRVLSEASESYGHQDQIDLVVPPSPEYGDLACALPIRIARGASRKPGEVAIELASKVMNRLSGTKYIGSVTPHRGGYVNFSINYGPFIADSIKAITSGEMGERAGVGQTIAVEHTNVNPNKALHIGHARNLVLGDSLVRVLRYLGNDVQALNYIDDSGAQVADVVVGFKFLGYSDEPPEGSKYDSYCGDEVYVKVNQEYAKDPSLKEKQSLVLKEVEKGTGPIAEYARSIVARILAAQLQTCWRMGARYDLLNWESHIVHSGMWDDIFSKMKESGLVRLETEGDNKGCWVIPDPESGEQKVVVRSDGTVVYVAKDIPYAAWKIGLIGDPFGYGEYPTPQPEGPNLYTTTLDKGTAKKKFGGADLAISVIDTRQSYLQRIVSKVLESLSKGASKRYLHRSYEVVAISKRTALRLGFEVVGEFAHMSGRKGLFVNADAVLSALKEKAQAETRRRNLSETKEWVDDVAEAVAVSALRYELLKQDPDKMIVFDLEESLRFQGDTGPYLLYTYARARRILGKTAGSPGIDQASAAKLVLPQEKALAKKLSMLDRAVASAGEYRSPREVAKYGHELAVAFNEFYESVQVNKEEDAVLRNARLALVDSASKVLAKSMDLMGLPIRQKI